ncbi:unnamed protein product [Diabrotica balteata]|uniref:Zinc finger PHD-type domain-containing protein n=1 Tax=Diabrotica balteata TaxID=107213 RepID=A0A9N9XGW3_DIABA|nr:unnamed protein product [Diabrotica balteata]
MPLVNHLKFANGIVVIRISTDPAPETSILNPKATVDHILKTPTTSKRPERSRKRDASAKCLTPINENTSVTENLQQQPSTSYKSVQKAKKSEIDDWECGLCGVLYSTDVKKRNGAQWIQCSSCLTPYHEICISIEDTDADEKLYYRCDRCME